MLSPARAKWFVVALAFLVPVLFAAFTGHAWEDYFITLRASRNLVEGHGLVFTPGERLHTFTSPLGVLLPALCTAVAGPGREELALWLFRVLNAALLALAALLIWRRADTLRLGTPGRVVLFGLMICDAKLTDFSTNGMETAILVLFVIFLWSELEAPAGPRWTGLAVAFGGLMWTRPDAFTLAGAIVVPHLLFRRRYDEGRTRIPWSPLVRGALLGGLLYLPWFVWAWWYYGTPVPHTIIAKSNFIPATHLTDILLVPLRVLTGQSLNGDLFQPAYAVFGGWPVGLRYFSFTLTLAAAFGWIVPGWPVAGRRLSLALFFGLFYICSITLFPWYVPPWAVIGIIAFAFAFDTLCARAVVAGPRLASVARIAACFLVLVPLATLGAVAWQMRVHQRLVETGVRRAIGEWLHGHAAPGDTLFLEPLGYIGYFSQLKTYDFPGLSSPEVVAAVRAGARSYPAIIARLKPRWVVLRPHELASQVFLQEPALKDYTLVKIWSALPELNAVPILPGRKWSEYEAHYFLLRRKADAP
ncbi:MAG: hypothetical protein NTV51_08850 [Verrucomicrobia bacterium]|nr:hypothetical protein [Verrucomicrobiota bacterium]